MEKVSLPILGMSTTNAYKNGDCITLVNLRNRNGVLEPVPDITGEGIKLTVGGYTQLYWHKSSRQKNLVGIRRGVTNDDGTFDALYWVYKPQSTPNEERKLFEVVGDVKIHHNGNMLVVIDSEGIKTALFKDGEYRAIPNITDNADNGDFIVPTVGLRVTAIDKVLRYETGFTPKIETENVYKQNGTLRDALLGTYAKARGMEAKRGFLNGYVWARTALKLYDGSYVLHGKPILLGASGVVNLHENPSSSYGGWSVFPTNDANSVWDSENECWNVAVVDRQFLPNQGDFTKTNFFSGNQVGDLPNQKGTVGHFDFFCNSVSVQNKDGGKVLVGRTDIFLQTQPNRLQYKIKREIVQGLEDIVQSVDVFLSREVMPTKPTASESVGRRYDNDFKSLFHNTITAEYQRNWQNVNSMELWELRGFLKDNTDIEKELLELSNFYKVYEIPLDKVFNTDGWVDIDLSGKLGDNLVNQDRLPVDNFSYHSLVPGSSLMYNRRFHIANYTQRLSDGYSVGAFFFWDKGWGQFRDNEIVNNSNYEIFIKTTLKTADGTKIVMRRVKGKGFLYAPTVIGYPDSRAVEQEIWVTDGRSVEHGDTYGYWHIKKELKPHDSLNVSMAVELQGFVSDDEYDFDDTLPNFLADFTINNTIRTDNVIKVSRLNNPIVYESKNTYPVGDSDILAIEVNAIYDSAGSSGEYPLYVFTEKMIYALYVGSGNVVYGRVSPIRTDNVISPVVCRTPFGVVFVSTNGLRLINGAKVDALADNIWEKPPEMILDDRPNCELSPEIINIDVYLKGQEITSMAFNEFENELILSVKDWEHKLVVGFDGFHYLSTIVFDTIVGGDSDLQVVNGQSVHCYNKPTNDKVQISFLLRPLRFAGREYSRIDRFILRAMLEDCYFDIMQHVSLDGRYFETVRGYRFRNNVCDIDMGLIALKCKSYLLSGGGAVDVDTRIYGIDVLVEKLYKNEKMR